MAWCVGHQGVGRALCWGACWLPADGSRLPAPAMAQWPSVSRDAHRHAARSRVCSSSSKQAACSALLAQPPAGSLHHAQPARHQAAAAAEASQPTWPAPPAAPAAAPHLVPPGGSHQQPQRAPQRVPAPASCCAPAAGRGTEGCQVVRWYKWARIAIRAKRVADCPAHIRPWHAAAVQPALHTALGHYILHPAAPAARCACAAPVPPQPRARLACTHCHRPHMHSSSCALQQHRTAPLHHSAPSHRPAPHSTAAPHHDTPRHALTPRHTHDTPHMPSPLGPAPAWRRRSWPSAARPTQGMPRRRRSPRPPRQSGPPTSS